MNIENKKTALDDEAALYHHSDHTSEKEKWAGMTAAKRWDYFKTYYLKKILVILLCAVAVGSIIYSMVKPKEEVVFSVAIVNVAMRQDLYMKVQEDMEKLLEIDKETQKIIFDGGYDFETDVYSAMQKFSLYNTTGELDVTILPLSEFEKYACVGHFSPVSEHLQTGLYNQLSDHFIVCGQKDDKGEWIEDSENVYGIRIDQTQIYENYETKEPVILAINKATKHNNEIAKFLEYLFFPE